MQNKMEEMAKKISETVGMETEKWIIENLEKLGLEKTANFKDHGIELKGFSNPENQIIQFFVKEKIFSEIKFKIETLEKTIKNF